MFESCRGKRRVLQHFDQPLEEDSMPTRHSTEEYSVVISHSTGESFSTERETGATLSVCL